MTEATSTARLQAGHLTLDPAIYGRVNDFSASFAPGLTLLVDEEGEAVRLLRVLAGESAAQAGSLTWCGISLADQLRQFPQTVFWQDPRAPWPDHSPEQWMYALAARYPTWETALWQRLVRELALQEHLHKEMFRLSTGSKRKVLLAGALASGAALTLLDEPEAALDWSSISCLREALAGEARRCQQTQRVFVVANYEEVPQVPWGQILRL